MLKWRDADGVLNQSFQTFKCFVHKERSGVFLSLLRYLGIPSKSELNLARHNLSKSLKSDSLQRAEPWKRIAGLEYLCRCKEEQLM